MSQALPQTDSAQTARERILDAAEIIFSEEGFSGASMKAIASGAGVAQGLLHYHFENKDGLYTAVIARRADSINAERMELLDKVDMTAPDAVERIMEALLRPPLNPGDGQWAYARIFSNLAMGAGREAALVAKLYDPTARKFIAALQQISPDTSPLTISWAYSFAIGVLAATVSSNGRPERLAGLSSPQADTEATVGRLVTYATGGFKAAIAGEAANTRT